MNTGHLTEEQLQLYADNIETVDTDLRTHVTHCLHCQLRVENYRLISSALKEIPSPAFDFDLAEEVLASVPLKKTPIAPIPLLTAITGILLIIGMAGLYARQIAILFWSLPQAWGYVLTIPAMVFLLVQLTLSVAEHQRKMNRLLSK